MKTNRRRFLAACLGSATLPALRRAAAASLPDSVSPEALASDPLRPQYHLLPAANWMNDPNGPIYWNGNYHMFYQYNPNGAYWGDMHWGHAVSQDMVHWRHLPIALAPTPGGPDASGCYTGTAVVKGDRVVIMYTGVKASSMGQATIKGRTPPLRETQCLAIAADPDLITWSKVPTPVIETPPPQLEVNGFRDPSPWRQGDWWYTVLASGVADQGGAVLLYRSKDLHNWEYLHTLSKRNHEGLAAFDPFDPWEVWECPEFFLLGDWHVLIYSTADKTYWQSGKLDSEKMIFHPVQAGTLDYGSYYAAKTQLDKSGDRIIWGWIKETRPLAEYKAAGWAGMMSLPRVLSVTGDGRLHFRVADAVHRLRGREQALTLTGDEQIIRQINGFRIAACCGEIHCVTHRTGTPFELALRGPEDNVSPWLTLHYDPRHPSQIFVDGRPLPLTLDSSEDLKFHLYVDGSVIEVFVNDQIAFTKRFYYSGRNPRDLHLQWNGSTASIASLSLWQLSPISSNRLTI